MLVVGGVESTDSQEQLYNQRAWANLDFVADAIGCAVAVGPNIWKRRAVSERFVYDDRHEHGA